MRVCSTCNATWIGEQLYWSTGKEGCPHDLAGLVCNTLKDYGYAKGCINPCKGSTSGVTRHCLLYTSDAADE